MSRHAAQCSGRLLACLPGVSQQDTGVAAKPNVKREAIEVSILDLNMFLIKQSSNEWWIGMQLRLPVDVSVTTTVSQTQQRFATRQARALQPSGSGQGIVLRAATWHICN